ncbi:BRO family protein [Methylorubrum populi]
MVNRTDLALPAGRPMVAVSESGFFKLVLRSDKPEALAFQEWVTREVLPAIRRSGGYRLAGTAPEAVEEGTVAEMPDVGGVMAQEPAGPLCGAGGPQSLKF